MSWVQPFVICVCVRVCICQTEFQPCLWVSCRVLLPSTQVGVSLEHCSWLPSRYLHLCESNMYACKINRSFAFANGLFLVFTYACRLCLHLLAFCNDENHHYCFAMWVNFDSRYRIRQVGFHARKNSAREVHLDHNRRYVVMNRILSFMLFVYFQQCFDWKIMYEYIVRKENIQLNWISVICLVVVYWKCGCSENAMLIFGEHDFHIDWIENDVDELHGINKLPSNKCWAMCKLRNITLHKHIASIKQISHTHYMNQELLICL